jgi:hypothetical protein
MLKRLAKFRRRELWHLMPRFDVAHCNDNQRGFRRRAGRCPPAQPALTCHWLVADGVGLQCRWKLEAPTKAPANLVNPQ